MIAALILPSYGLTEADTMVKMLTVTTVMGDRWAKYYDAPL